MPREHKLDPILLIDSAVIMFSTVQLNLEDLKFVVIRKTMHHFLVVILLMQVLQAKMENNVNSLFEIRGA